MIERRPLGGTGESLSVIGFGGILVTDETASEAARLVGKAVDLSVNYFDVAPTYGNAEAMLGPALEPHRKNVFLACKTTERSKDGASKGLRESLGRLKTDHVDLYQMHGLSNLDEVDEAFGKSGALEAFVEAKKTGLARFLGFSAHTEEAALAAIDRFPFDTVLFPLNIYAWHLGVFGRRLVPRAAERGMGILALKALAKRDWRKDEKRAWSKTWYAPVDTYEEAELGIRFTLSLPVTAAVTPGHEQFFDWAVQAAGEFTPLSEAEAASRARTAAGPSPMAPASPIFRAPS
jgi:aryl-alcohol dehydrogenase-like predicted oxidoreductase